MRVGTVGFPSARYGQRARYNKTIPVVAYATGLAVGREGPIPVGYKCRSGVFPSQDRGRQSATSYTSA